MSQSITQRQNIITRTALSSSQLIDRSITNGAKLINLPPESPLFGRSNKLVSDLFETKEPVHNCCVTYLLPEGTVIIYQLGGWRNLGGHECIFVKCCWLLGPLIYTCVISMVATSVFLFFYLL